MLKELNNNNNKTTKDNEIDRGAIWKYAHMEISFMTNRKTYRFRVKLNECNIT